MTEMGTLDHFNLFVASPIVATMEKMTQGSMRSRFKRDKINFENLMTFLLIDEILITCLLFTKISLKRHLASNKNVQQFARNFHCNSNIFQSLLNTQDHLILI
jgi:hypothetical protein